MSTQDHDWNFRMQVTNDVENQFPIVIPHALDEIQRLSQVDVKERE